MKEALYSSFMPVFGYKLQDEDEHLDGDWITLKLDTLRNDVGDGEVALVFQRPDGEETWRLSMYDVKEVIKDWP